MSVHEWQQVVAAAWLVIPRHRYRHTVGRLRTALIPDYIVRDVIPYIVAGGRHLAPHLSGFTDGEEIFAILEQLQ